MHHCKWFWIRQVLSARFFQDLLSIQQLLLRTNESLWAHLKVWPILLQITDRESRFPTNHWMMPAGQLWKSAICVREVCRKHFHLLHRMQTSGLAQWYPGVTFSALWRGSSDAAWFLGAQPERPGGAGTCSYGAQPCCCIPTVPACTSVTKQEGWVTAK